jgi:hypothetical protein
MWQVFKLASEYSYQPVWVLKSKIFGQKSYSKESPCTFLYGFFNHPNLSGFFFNQEIIIIVWEHIFLFNYLLITYFSKVPSNFLTKCHSLYSQNTTITLKYDNFGPLKLHFLNFLTCNFHALMMTWLLISEYTIWEKGPSINNVGNFSGFLKPPPPCWQSFSTIRRQFWPMFDSSQLPMLFMESPGLVENALP